MVDHAHPPMADDFQHVVLPDPLTGEVDLRRREPGVRLERVRHLGAGLRVEHVPDLLLHVVVALTGLGQPRRALTRRLIQRPVKERLNPLPALLVHRIWVKRYERVAFQRRSRGRLAMSSCCAVSSTLSPPKKRSSTAFAISGSNSASVRDARHFLVPKTQRLSA